MILYVPLQRVLELPRLVGCLVLQRHILLHRLLDLPTHVAYLVRRYHVLALHLDQVRVTLGLWAKHNNHVRMALLGLSPLAKRTLWALWRLVGPPNQPRLVLGLQNWERNLELVQLRPTPPTPRHLLCQLLLPLNQQVLAQFEASLDDGNLLMPNLEFYDDMLLAAMMKRKGKAPLGRKLRKKAAKKA